MLFSSDASTLLLDEPDNFLDIPAKRWLEERLQTTKKTVLMISHDRDLLAAGVNRVVTLEATGAWVHGGSYATYAAAREHRQQLLGDALAALERRGAAPVPLLQDDEAAGVDLARRSRRAPTRPRRAGRRFVAAGPPPAPAPDQACTCACAAVTRRAASCA